MNSKTRYGDKIMKTKLVFLLSLITILVLSACTGTISPTGSSTQTVTNETSQLPILPRLVVGTYKLIGSSTPITQTQAQQLVILWKAYKELQTRDTKAQQEVTDLLSQINSSLTTDQNSAIDAMNLSARDVTSMMQELGVAAAQTNNRSTTSQSSSSGNSSRQQGGGFPGGGAPGDGGGFPGGGVPPADGGGFAFGGGGGGTSATPSASMLATIQARRAGSGAQTTTMVLLLIDPLITKLESIAKG
jgi:hypothetical protein